MRMITWRDLFWVALAIGISSWASAALATAIVAAPANLLDLQWLVICGAAGLTMFGGVVGTLFAVHSAGDKGKDINIRLQLALNLGIAVSLGLPAYGAQSVYGWRPEVLLALPLLGAAGPYVFAPVLKIVSQRVVKFLERLVGGKETE